MDQLAATDYKDGERSKNNETEWLSWSQDKKDKSVSTTLLRLQGFLDSVGASAAIKDAYVAQYNANTTRFRDEIPGSAHDEYHMAKVTHWAMEIWKSNKDAIPSDKQKVFGLALISAAMNHDMGDIPKRDFQGNQEPFFVSQRSESESVRINEDFLIQLDRADLSVDKEELMTLSTLMVASTCNDLDFDFNFGQPADINQLGISRLIDAQFGEGNGYIPPSNNAKVFETANIAKASVATLKTKYGWTQDELKTAVRVIDSADYASYFFERSIQESMALLGEFQEIAIVDGKLVSAKEDVQHYLDWLKPNFQERVYGFYQDYFPAEAAQALADKRKLSNKLKVIGDTNIFDPDYVFRLESAFLPVDYLKIARAFKVDGDDQVQQTLVEYSRVFRQAQDNPDVGRISGPSSEVTSAIFDQLDDAGKKEFVSIILEQAHERIAQEKAVAYIHIAPGRYSGGDTSMAALMENELKTHTGRYSRIKGLYLTFRQDKDDLSAIDEFAQHNLTNTGKEIGIAIGGANSSVEKVGKVLDKLYFRSYAGNVMVHCGLESSEEEFQAIMTKVAACASNGMAINVHLDAHYDRMVRWLASNGDKPGLNIIAAPLVNIMKDPSQVADLKTIEGIVGKPVAISSNNAQSLSGGMAFTVARAIVGHK